MKCNHCKNKITDKTRRKFCSDDCGYKFHQVKYRKLQKIKTIEENNKSKENYKKVIIPTSKQNINKLVPLALTNLNSTERISYSSTMRTANIIPTIQIIKKKTIRGDIRVYNSNHYTIKEVNKAIKFFDIKMKYTQNIAYKYSIKRLFDLRKEMENYLKEN